VKNETEAFALPLLASCVIEKMNPGCAVVSEGSAMTLGFTVHVAELVGASVHGGFAEVAAAPSPVFTYRRMLLTVFGPLLVSTRSNVA